MLPCLITESRVRAPKYPLRLSRGGVLYLSKPLELWHWLGWQVNTPYTRVYRGYWAIVYRAVGEAISLRHWGGCTAAVTTNWAWLQDWRQEVEGGVNGTGIVPHVDWARQNHDFATLANLA